MSEVLAIHGYLSLLEGVVVHSDVASHPKDIDLYVPAKQLDSAKRILQDNCYICVSDTNYHSLYAKFENGELFIFDLTTDYHYYLARVPSIELSSEGSRTLGTDCQANISFKKLISSKILQDDDISVLKKFFARSDNFSNIPIKRLNSYEDFIALQKSISREARFHLIGFRIRLFFQRFNKGKSYGFVGPDGSGKGFFIDKLKQIQPIKVVYMGDWFFRCQRLYSALLKLPSPLNRFLHFFYFFENIMRRLKVSFWNAAGYDVFIDRFPGTNSPVTLTGIPGFINRMIFMCTPKPDLFVLLYARPEVVFSRKAELTIDQIFMIQQSQREILSKSNHIVIDTESMDMSLNFLLRKFYEIKV